MSTANLHDHKAIEKLKEIAENIDFAMMATNLGNIPFPAIPMSTKRVDDNGAIWFLSGKDSSHNQDILNNSAVQLLYSKPGDMEYMIVFGQAKIVTDQKTLEELYSSVDDNWFEGANDPNLSAIHFTPQDAHYWEAKNNKLVTLFKMAVGAVTGDQQDIGREGTISLS